MSVIRELRIPCFDASRIMIPCGQKDCKGEAIVDLSTLPVPKGDAPPTIYCSTCRQVVQSPVSVLLGLLQKAMVPKSEKPLFYFVIVDKSINERGRH